MQAITVKYIVATNNTGSRIKAKCEAGSVTIPYPSELSGQAVYRKAAEKLVEKMQWTGECYGRLVGGELNNGDYVFVFDNVWGSK